MRVQVCHSRDKSILRTGFQNLGLFKNLTTGGAVMKGICFMLACFMAFSVGLYGQEALTIDDIIDWRTLEMPSKRRHAVAADQVLVPTNARG